MSGHISHSSTSGFKYFIIFIDDHSRFGWIKISTKKFKTLDAFMKFMLALLCLLAIPNKEFDLMLKNNLTML